LRQPILSPDKFTEWFNSVVPGAYRKLTAEDARDMAECKLIGKYGYYSYNDLEVVRAVLQYEQFQNERSQKEDKVRLCKRCGRPLPENGNGRGRPREYCSECDIFRGRERYKKWHSKMLMVQSHR